MYEAFVAAWLKKRIAKLHALPKGRLPITAMRRFFGRPSCGSSRAPDGCVGGRRIEDLPADLDSLIRYLEISIGIGAPGRNDEDASPSPDDTAAAIQRQIDEEARAQERQSERANVRLAFQKRFGFSFEDYARWLFANRASDPVLYVLLLSREYPLALQRAPVLGASPDGNAVIPGLQLPAIVAAMAFGELQRLAALYRNLVADGRTGTSDIRAEADRGGASKWARGWRAARQVMSRTGKGAVYDRAPFRAEALRKRLMLLPGRKLSKLDGQGVLSALAGGRDDWDDASSGKTKRGAHELLKAVFAPAIFEPRTRGKGQGHHDDRLDLYYGIPPEYLLHLGVTEIGMMFTGNADRASTVVLVDCMLVNLGSEAVDTTAASAPDSGAHEARHRHAMEALRHYLPQYPRKGSGGRFNLLMWLEKERDASLFVKFLEPIRSPDKRLHDRDYVGKFYVALWYLQMRFPRLFDRFRAHGIAARLFCHVASSASVITSDPIYWRLLRRTREMMFPKQKRLKQGQKKRERSRPSNGNWTTRPTVSHDAVRAAIVRTFTVAPLK